MAIRYKTLINQLYAEHELLLAQFDEIHRAFALNQQANQTKFNHLGHEVVEIIRGYEQQLCGKSERAGMGVYSSKLAETFWKEIKKRYPLIDFVGVSFS